MRSTYTLVYSLCCPIQNRPSLPKLPIGQLGSVARLRNGDYIRPVVKRNRFTERRLDWAVLKCALSYND